MEPISPTGFAAMVAAALLFSMPVYIFVARKKPPTDPPQTVGGTLILGRWIRHWFIWVVGPLERALIKANVSPNVINAVGIALGLASGVAFALHHLAFGGWLLILGGIGDILDGRLARAQAQASKLGAFLDSTLDRFSEIFVFIGLSIFFESPLARVAVLVALGASLLTSYARARGESLGVLCKRGLVQRAERVALLGIAAVFDELSQRLLGWDEGRLLLLAVSLVAVGGLATAAYRTVWIARTLRKPME